MDNNLSRDILMLRGLGAASLASAFSFIAALILKYTEGLALLLYVMIPIMAVPVIIMLLSGNIRDVFIKLITFILTGTAFCMIFVRVGFVSAISRDIEKGIVDKNIIADFGIYGIIVISAVILISAAASVFLHKNKKYCSFIEKTDGFQQKMSVPSIAAAFVSMALASMIYG